MPERSPRCESPVQNSPCGLPRCAGNQDGPTGAVGGPTLREAEMGRPARRATQVGTVKGCEGSCFAYRRRESGWRSVNGVEKGMKVKGFRHHVAQYVPVEDGFPSTPNNCSRMSARMFPGGPSGYVNARHGRDQCRKRGFLAQRPSGRILISFREHLSKRQRRILFRWPHLPHSRSFQIETL